MLEFTQSTGKRPVAYRSEIKMQAMIELQRMLREINIQGEYELERYAGSRTWSLFNVYRNGYFEEGQWLEDEMATDVADFKIDPRGAIRSIVFDERHEWYITTDRLTVVAQFELLLALLSRSSINFDAIYAKLVPNGSNIDVDVIAEEAVVDWQMRGRSARRQITVIGRFTYDSKTKLLLHRAA